jgi:uncharacterized protein (TIGR03118 family)
VVLVALAFSLTAAGQGYRVQFLTSDGFPSAPNTDIHLIDAWGLARSPDGPWFVGSNGSDYARHYSPAGMPVSDYILGPPAPTGIVSYQGSQFVIGALGVMAPARFLFASETGVISGWNPNLPFPMSQFGIVAIDDSATAANYKGIAEATTAQGERLYATDFHNAVVAVFDGSFAPVFSGGGFVDPAIPSGYAPFGIARIDDTIYVTYALRNGSTDDPVAGAGLGFISTFTTSGVFITRFASNGPLDAPWGVALAPPAFGQFGGLLLVANHGDGRIHAFSRSPIQHRGVLRNQVGAPIVIGGLRGIGFGNGGAAGPARSLFFTAGPSNGAHGAFGTITSLGGKVAPQENDDVDDDEDEDDEE